MEKIKKANNQLFSDDDNQNNAKREFQSKQRVTFSSDIEEYDDRTSITDDESTTYKNDKDVDNEITEIIERSECASDEREIDEIDGLIGNISIAELFSNGNSLDEDYPTEIEVMNDTSSEHNTSQSNNSPAHQTVQSQSNLLRQNCGHNKTHSNDSHVNQMRLKFNLNFAPNKIKRVRPTSAKPFKYNANKSKPIFSIHLNIKSCCKHKLWENCRLPRYNGYISQYGMSKDQLEGRELNRQRSRVNRMRQQRQILHAKQEITALNEQAFRQWLIRKDRTAKPKYRNMYDFDTK